MRIATYEADSDKIAQKEKHFAYGISSWTTRRYYLIFAKFAQKQSYS